MVTQADLMPADGAHAARALGYLNRLLVEAEVEADVLPSDFVDDGWLIDLWAEAIERTAEGVSQCESATAC
jgi:hypothetical protein